jgi:phosphoinositide-3-kinase regulatory subunit 4
MLASMLALNPEDRPTCEKVLVDYRNTIFPDYFYTFLQDYVNDMQYKPESGSNAKAAKNPTVRFASKADEIVEAIADDWSGIIRAVLQEHQLSTGQTDEGEGDAGMKVVDNS